MAGSVCPVEEILSQQPNLKVLRDPPSLAGQRTRCVLAFHYRSEKSTVVMCKVRAQAWTDPLILSRWYSLDKEMSTLLATTVFDVAKAEFAKGNPDRMRAGEATPRLQDFF